MSQDYKPETLALHAGYRADPATSSVAVPIYQSTAFQFNDTEHAANLFALKELGNIYTRLMNPTCDVLEKRLAAIEGGAAALALSSGQSASFFAVMNLCQAGDNFISSTDLYGGTWNLFNNALKQMGVEVRFFDPNNMDQLESLIDEKTRCIYAETLPNPKLHVFPIKEVAAIGRAHGVPLIMDNTCAPIICNPLALGAAVVMYSATKFIGGHGTTLGGVIVDGGNFDWEAHGDRFPTLNHPDANYHGAIWTEAVKPLGPIAYILRMRCTLLRDLGAALSAQSAFQIIQGLETLPLRMRAHCENADKVAAFLHSHPAVESVIHPSLQTGTARDRADAALKNGYGSLVGFELKGGADAGKAFIEKLQLFYHVANIGDARSLAIHPATTTHSQLNAQEQLASGVTPGYIRLSIGIEHIDDILADLKQALETA
jgi:O-acetylhomoserine (thiol)-lyase